VSISPTSMMVATITAELRTKGTHTSLSGKGALQGTRMLQQTATVTVTLAAGGSVRKGSSRSARLVVASMQL
jgi:hypothetical protein